MKQARYNGRDLDEYGAIVSLKRKGCSIQAWIPGKQPGKIEISENVLERMGNKSWGCVDFLQNHCNYHVKKPIDVLSYLQRQNVK